MTSASSASRSDSWQGRRREAVRAGAAGEKRSSGMAGTGPSRRWGGAVRRAVSSSSAVRRRAFTPLAGRDRPWSRVREMSEGR